MHNPPWPYIILKRVEGLHVGNYFTKVGHIILHDRAVYRADYSGRLNVATKTGYFGVHSILKVLLLPLGFVMMITFTGFVGCLHHSIVQPLTL